MSVDWTSSGQQIAEGRVSDDETCAHYVAEEDAALWRYPAEPGAADPPEVVDRVRPDGYLAADIEGLALHRRPEGAGYLLTSSQGSDEHAVLRRIQPAARPPIGRTSSWSPGGASPEASGTPLLRRHESAARQRLVRLTLSQTFVHGCRLTLN